MAVINRLLLAAGGLIPCDGTSAKPCDYNAFILLIGKVFQFLTIDIAVPLATAAIVYGGIIMITAGTNETKRSQAKSIIGFAVWGLVLALAAYLIIKTIMVGLGVQAPFLPDFFQ